MIGIEITLVVVGVVFLLGSFFVKEKLSGKELQEIAKLSEKEIKIVMERQLNSANHQITSRVEDVIEESSAVTKRMLEKETNNKIMAINEYSDTVLEAINKAHNEVMFLYSMLNDKQAELTDFLGEVSEFASTMKNRELDTFTTSNVESTSIPVAERKYQQEEEAEPIHFTSLSSIAASVPASEALDIPGQTIESDEAEAIRILDDNHNREILQLHTEGKSKVQIARELGLGLGEVQLVLGLYEGEGAR